MNWLKTAVLILIVWSSFSASLTAYYYNSNLNLEKDVKYLGSSVTNSTKDLTTVVIVNFNNGTVKAKTVHFIIGNGFSAFNATLLAFGDVIDYKYYPEYKDFVISSFFGISNVGSSFWSLYINGVASNSGALKTVLSADDVIEWKYQKF